MPAVHGLNDTERFPDQQALGMGQVALGHDNARRAGTAVKKIGPLRSIGERDNL